MKQAKTRKNLGVTLLELLTVITILIILVAIGYPNYMKTQYETRRTDAKTMLLHVHSTIQNYLIANNSVALQASELNTLFPSLPITSKGGYYSITVDISASPTYIITATATGNQVNDTNCRYIVMSNTGTTVTKSARKSNNVTDSTSICW